LLPKIPQSMGSAVMRGAFVAKLACLVLLGSTSAYARPLDSVVVIRGDRGKNSSLGAGFFISADGLIATAYHVVQGASALQISWHDTQLRDVQVVGYDNVRDLALLKVAPMSRQAFPPLTIVDPPSSLTQAPGVALGHGEGILDDTIQVSFAQDVPMLSMSISLNGSRLFARDDIPIILLNGAIDLGMSGGPVVVGGSAIGVVSGSLTKGGSGLAWAIPARQISTISRGVYALSNLPPIGLLVSGEQLQLRILKKDASVLDTFSQPQERVWQLLTGTEKIHSLVQEARESFPSSQDIDALEQGRGDFDVVRKKFSVSSAAFGRVVSELGTMINGPYSKSLAQLKARVLKEQSYMHTTDCSSSSPAFLVHTQATDDALARSTASSDAFPPAAAEFFSAFKDGQPAVENTLARYHAASGSSEKRNALDAVMRSFAHLLRAVAGPFDRTLAAVDGTTSGFADSISECGAALNVAAGCRGYRDP
jgi:hypothetical protein